MIFLVGFVAVIAGDVVAILVVSVASLLPAGIPAHVLHVTLHLPALGFPDSLQLVPLSGSQAMGDAVLVLHIVVLAPAAVAVMVVILGAVFIAATVLVPVLILVLVLVPVLALVFILILIFILVFILTHIFGIEVGHFEVIDVAHLDPDAIHDEHVAGQVDLVQSAFGQLVGAAGSLLAFADEVLDGSLQLGIPEGAGGRIALTDLGKQHAEFVLGIWVYIKLLGNGHAVADELLDAHFICFIALCHCT